MGGGGCRWLRLLQEALAIPTVGQFADAKCRVPVGVPWAAVQHHYRVFDLAKG